MKRLFLSAGALLISFIWITKVTGQSALFVKERTGAQTVFPFSGIRALYFPAGSMIVESTDASPVNYALTDIRLLSFKNYFTAIVDPKTVRPGTIRVFPNPASSSAYIEYSGTNASGRTIEILDLQGRMIETAPMQGVTSSIDLTNLKPGIYICRLRNDPEGLSAKIIINR